MPAVTTRTTTKATLNLQAEEGKEHYIQASRTVSNDGTTFLLVIVQPNGGYAMAKLAPEELNALALMLQALEM